MKNRPSPKVVQMPSPRAEPPVEPQPEPLSEAEWEQIAQEIFAERKCDVGRVPDRRSAPLPPWQPPSGK